MSLDPLVKKLPQWSPYVAMGDDPVNNIDPDGQYFVGVNGKKVDVSYDKKGKIILGNNASPDLKRIALLFNEAGSKTAFEQFTKIASNGTKINLKIETTKEHKSNLFGYHQPHDKDGKALEFIGDDFGKFNGKPEYIMGADGKIEYKEATITIYEGFIKKNLSELKDDHDNGKLTVNQAIVLVTGHEMSHDLIQKDIKVLKKRSEGKTDGGNVEKAAMAIEYKIGKEIKASNP